MAEYKVKKGKQDRHGEMTGAITFNMLLSMVPVVIWAMFIGPMVFGEQYGYTLAIALGLALLLPFLFLKPSQKLWAWMSERLDRL